MFTSYDKLPETADRVAISNALHNVLEAMREELSIPEIVANVNRMNPVTPIKDNDLKMFMRRTAGTRVNKNNKTLRALFDYIKLHMIQRNSLTPQAMEVALRHIDVLEPGYESSVTAADKLFQNTIRASFGRTLRNWVQTDINTLKKLANRIDGDYVLLRKSSEFENVVLKSSIGINYDEVDDVLILTHSFIDREERERHSAGPVTLVHENLYAICPVEVSEAVEIISLSVPMQRDDIISLNGFTQTVDLHRVLVSARCVITRASEFWRTVPHRIEIDKSNIFRKSQNAMRLLKNLDEKKALTVPR